MLKNVSRSKLVYFCYAAVYVGWGTTYLAIRVGLESFGPASFLALRFLTASLFFLPFILNNFISRKNRIQVKGADVLWSILQGIGLLFLGLFPVALAEREIPSNITTLVIGSAPIGFAIFESLLNQKKMTVKQMISIGLGFTGILVLNFQDEGIAKASTLSFSLLIFGVIAWCFSSIFFKKRKSSLPVTWNVFFQYVGSGLCLAIYALYIEKFKISTLTHASTKACLALIYISLFPSIVSYGAYLWLLANEPSERVSTYAFVNPVVAMIAGFLVLSEPVSGAAVIAMTLILMGTYLILRKSKKIIPSQVSLVTPIQGAQDQLCSD